MEILKQANLYRLEQTWTLLPPHGTGSHVWWPWLKNYHGEGMTGLYNLGPMFARMWVDQKLKKSMGR